MSPASVLRGLVASALAAGAVAAAPSPAAAATPQPFGQACASQDGVRFCPSGTHRVTTFDGVPLDVDVTLPPSGDGPFPTIVMLHGFGNDKTDFESSTPEGDGSITYHYNNDYYARQGYAVVNYTARGFGDSCGGGPTKVPAYTPGSPCADGYIRLADTRHEARDAQTLLGMLVDEQIAQPGALGVTGISYGGGQSLELAYLHDKIRLPNGALAPWTSPKGTPLSIAAAYARWPWSDLVDSLLPNGRFVDTQVAPPRQSLDPVGIPIQSYITGLYALGFKSGYYCGVIASGSTPCTDRDANLTQDIIEVSKGLPLTADGQQAIAGIYDHDQAYGLDRLPGASTPAPMLIENGWTDDLFPPEQALRVYNEYPDRTTLQFGDLGHSRGANKPTVNRPFNDQGAAFFAGRLRGQGQPPAPGSVTAYTQTCPTSAPDGGPFQASSYSKLAPYSATFGSATTKLVTAAGNPVVSAQFDPILDGQILDSKGIACKSVRAVDTPGTAVYQATVNRSFTMIGLPTVRASIATVGPFGELDSQLFDVDPKAGTERLISRGAYRLTTNQTGRVTFQLHGNGYRFERGHVVKLVLVGNDAPYLRPSNDPAFTVRVSGLQASLPTVTRPGSHGVVSGGSSGGSGGSGPAAGGASGSSTGAGAEAPRGGVEAGVGGAATPQGPDVGALVAGTAAFAAGAALVALARRRRRHPA